MRVNDLGKKHLPSASVVISPVSSVLVSDVSFFRVESDVFDWSAELLSSWGVSGRGLGGGTESNSFLVKLGPIFTTLQGNKTKESFSISLHVAHRLKLLSYLECPISDL